MYLITEPSFPSWLEVAGLQVCQAVCCNKVYGNEKEIVALVMQLDEDGRQKAGTLPEDELVEIYDGLHIMTAPFFKGRIEAAINSRSKGHFPLSLNPHQAI